MNRTAPSSDRRPPQGGRPPGPLGTPPAPPHDALCAPVPRPRIRLAFAISIECDNIHYRTAPVELVAEPVQGGAGSAECGMAKAPSAPDAPHSPLDIPHSALPIPPSAPDTPHSPLDIPHSALPTPHSALDAPHSPLPIPHSPLPIPHSLYSLRKGFGVWRLVFEGRETLLRPERGLLYVAWLLHHPPAQPLHAVDLAARIPELYRAQLGLSVLADPATGQAAALSSHARLQERSFARDDADSLRALRRQEQALEAVLDDESATEPEKAEALRDLEALAEFQRRHGHRSKDAAARAVRTVRKALDRLHARLAKTLATDGGPHPVLRPFAEHLRQHLLVPSARYTGRGNRHARSGLAGCFTYEPPAGVSWSS